MRIFSVDPGLTTGIAWYSQGGMASEQLPAMEAVHSVKFHGLVDLLIVENFVPRRGKAMTWQPDALHVIGALRYHCWENDVDFVLQSPIAMPRQLGLERQLRERGWWKPTPGGHENAARKHLLMALQKRGLA